MYKHIQMIAGVALVKIMEPAYLWNIHSSANVFQVIDTFISYILRIYKIIGILK